MGLHRYLNDLDPLFLYTFDPDESYSDDNTGVGVYINKTEKDYPDLVCSRRTFLDRNYYTGSLEYRSLSQLEIGSQYKSVNLGISDPNNIQYENTNRTGVVTTPSVAIVESSNMLEADFSDVFSSIPNQYSIVMQIQVDRIANISTVVPVYLENSKKWVHSETNPFNVNSYNEPYFMFGRVRMYVTSTRVLFGNPNTGANVQINLASTYLLTILVSGQTVSIYSNSSLIGSYTSTTNDQYMQVGYNTRSVYNEAASNHYLEPTYNIYCPAAVLKVDNLGVYPRHLTNKEIVKVSDLNIDYLTRYSNMGYWILYDFASWYSSAENHRIYNRRRLDNIIGSSTPLKLFNFNGEGTTVEKVVNQDYEYTCTISEHGSFLSYELNEAIASYRPMFSSAGSLTFNFSTSDQDGILYSTSDPVNNSRNLALIFISGSLRVVVNGDDKINISGLANGEMHSICLTFTTTRTQLYIDDILFYTYTGNLIPTDNMFTQFGGSMPGGRFMLACTFAMIGYTSMIHTTDTLERLKSSTELYSATGIVTLNNIAVGTNIYVYNRDSGQLIETIRSSTYDGIFVYQNKNPYTIMILVADNSRLGGATYIVDPVVMK